MLIRCLPFFLVFLAVVPDALSYPGLRVVVSERFARSDSSSQLFLLAALVGAFAALPCIVWVRRFSTGRVVLVAGVLQAIVVGMMAAPVSWWGLLVLRTVQGGFDLLTLALLTGAAVRASGGTGRTFGIIGAVIMAGLGCGFGFGGAIAGIAPWFIFPLMSILALLLGLGGLLLARSTQGEHVQATPKRAHSTQTRAVGIACLAGDRFLSGVSMAILPLLLTGALGISTALNGIVMGLPLGMAAFGGLFAGLLVDAFGAGRVRAVGCVIYGAGLLLLVSGIGESAMIVIATVAMGIGITAILPTAFVLGTKSDDSGGDPAVIGRIQAGGQVGFIVGVLGAMGLTVYFGQASSTIIVLAVGFYLAWNGFWLVLGWQSTQEDPAIELSADRAPQAGRSARPRRIQPPAQGATRPSVMPHRRPAVASVED